MSGMTKFQSQFLTAKQARELAMKDRRNVVFERVSDVKETQLWKLEDIDRVLRSIRRSVVFLKKDYPTITHDATRELLLTDPEFLEYSLVYKHSFDLISNPELTEEGWERATRMFERAKMVQQGEMSSAVAGMETQVDQIKNLSRPMTEEELKEVQKPLT